MKLLSIFLLSLPLQVFAVTSDIYKIEVPEQNSSSEDLTIILTHTRNKDVSLEAVAYCADYDVETSGRVIIDVLNENGSVQNVLRNYNKDEKAAGMDCNDLGRSLSGKEMLINWSKGTFHVGNKFIQMLRLFEVSYPQISSEKYFGKKGIYDMSQMLIAPIEKESKFSIHRHAEPSLTLEQKESLEKKKLKTILESQYTNLNIDSATVDKIYEALKRINPNKDN